MPSLIKILTKSPGQVWISTTDENRDLYFSTSEVTNIIEPYIQFEQSLTGLVSQSNTRPSPNVSKFTYVFDTLEHLLAAKSALSNTSIEVVKNKQDLITGKLAELGIDYTVEIDIEY